MAGHPRPAVTLAEVAEHVEHVRYVAAASRAISAWRGPSRARIEDLDLDQPAVS